MKRKCFVTGCFLAGMLLTASVGRGQHALSGYDDKSHITGPKLTERDLEGKVVLVEVWGLRCPPCRASLPHMQALYEKHSKRGNFMLIGSHVQERNEDQIKALLKEAKVTYPIYQRLKIEGFQSPGHIPAAALIDHKGKLVTSGRLNDVVAALTRTLQAAPVPIAGSLLGAMEVVHNKGVERRLVFGQNVEPVVTQLSARGKQESEAGKEAARIVEVVEAALSEREGVIREQLGSAPSLALASIAEFGKTAPSRAAQFAAEYKSLSSSADVRKLREIRAEVAKMEALDPKSKGAAKNAVQQAGFKRRQFVPLTEHSDDAIKTEASDLMTQFDALVEGWSGML